jgi:hypothetical protein
MVGGNIMTLLSLVEAIDTLLSTVKDGDTPTANNYFDHVWIGKPDKIPMGARCVSFIEIGEEPTFYYSSCNTNTQSDVDVYITIMSKGHVETAHKHLYTVTDAVKDTLLANSKIGNTCLDSTIERIEYGDVAESQTSPKILATASRIQLRCRMV